MALSDFSHLHSLAHLYDIQTSYYDIKRVRRNASPEVLLAMLRALGAPVHSSHHVPTAIHTRRKTWWEQPLDPVVVAWEGKPALVDVRVSARDSGRSIHCRLELETGTYREWTFNPDNLRTVRTGEVDGEKYFLKRLNLFGRSKRALPSGYHRLKVELGCRSSEALLIAAPIRAFEPTRVGAPRSWGVFIPLYALHSSRSWGAGDCTDLESLMHWVGGLGGGVVATLPLLPAFFDDLFDPSPYSPVSRLFWSEFYADVHSIPELQRCPEARALLDSAEVKAERDVLRSAPLVDYKRQMRVKRRVLETLARSLFKKPSLRREAFRQYIQNHPTVEDYARFRATGERQQVPWQKWPQRLRDGHLKHGDYDEHSMRYHLYAQWVTKEQLQSLADRTVLSDRSFYLDLPLGVHPSGYDVWRERHAFVVEATGGAPPDAVFTKGQDWGFPPLHPEELRKQEYRHFIAYVRHHMERAGILRIDHVMGLHRLYTIPKGFEQDQGAYIRYRSEELYAILSLESHRHKTWLVGENLGIVPSQVNASMARHKIHSMYVIQYELSAGSTPVPRPVPRNSVASINTHDMPPFAAYWKGLDLDDKVEFGLLDRGEFQEELKARQHLKHSLGRFLNRHRYLPTSTPDLLNMLRGCLRFLSVSRARLLLVNLEDLWLETQPQNVPDSKGFRPNWTRRARYALERICEMPELSAILRDLDHLRKEPRKKLVHPRTR